jgi:non-ribosomal peptide synthetase component E (peptide arylation enzyme)
MYIKCSKIFASAIFTTFDIQSGLCKVQILVMMIKAAIYGRKTIPDLLITAAEKNPGKGLGFARPDGNIHFLSYSEMLRRAKSISSGMHALGMNPGEKVMIIISGNEDIIPLVWGCFLGGYIPTILQPPVSFTEFNQPAQKIINVFRILENPRVILSHDLMQGFQSEVIPSECLIDPSDLNGTFPRQYRRSERHHADAQKYPDQPGRDQRWA